MNPVQGLGQVHMTQVVGDRPGNGRRGDRQAFDRAMQEQEGEAVAEADAGHGAETPKPTALQPQPAGGRKGQQSQLRHVDVYA